MKEDGTVTSISKYLTLSGILSSLKVEELAIDSVTVNVPSMIASKVFVIRLLFVILFYICEGRKQIILCITFLSV